MAINRTLNAIWAEISAWGSLIKTATTTYVPSPGTLTVTDSAGNSNPNTANNQGVYAITSGTPFIVLNPDGTSSDIPVATALSAVGSLNPTALDENSGQAQVIRQYGDIYMYNDGNIYMWGGNGKNFNFGNGYEESHGWAGQACVYNNEVFTFPQGAMSLFLLQSSPPSSFSPPASLDDYEWLGGNVSKSWGNDYTFTYGSSYEWSSGPSVYVDAYGNTGDALTDVMQGKHCTFSYGTGYEEALVAWDQGSGWFHADDSNSPYVNRKHDSWQSSFLQLETVASSFAPGDAQATSPLSGLLSGDQLEEMTDTESESQAFIDEVFDPQDFNARNTWLVQNLLVSKTFGNTYEYHNGPGLSVQEGPSEERVYGNSSSTVVGNSTESVTGNSTSTVTGNSSETVTGNSTSMIQGNSTEQFWGGKAEFFMGGKSEMILGASDEIVLAMAMEIKTGGAIEVFGGIALTSFLGALIETAMSVKFEYGAVHMKTKSMTIELKEAATVDVTAGVNATATALKINA